jgi:lipopolysaccharide/colanic/teichoic acid biosynthesis glycosyltransferase
VSNTDFVIKRTFDLFFSVIGLLCIWWIIVIAWLIATIETKSNGFFIQKRIGKDGRSFNVIKIKTMKNITGIDTTITSSNDVRITKSGKFFRSTKIDELPQLLNVFLGHMSFVGPRPDVAGYADKLKGSDRIILKIRPGITGPASLRYKNEEEILSKQVDSKWYNDNVIWPDKVKINKKYIHNWSLKNDIKYIVKTIIG